MVDNNAAKRRESRKVELMKNNIHPEWMTLEEVADHLRLSRSKIYGMAQRGEIPCSKVVGRWRFFRAEVDEWMLQQRPARTDTRSKVDADE